MGSARMHTDDLFFGTMEGARASVRIISGMLLFPSDLRCLPFAKLIASGSSSSSATIRIKPLERLPTNPVTPPHAATCYQKQSLQPVMGRTNGAADVLHQMISIAISSSISSSSSSSALRRSFADRGAASGVKSAFSQSINPIAHPSLTF